ncbi:MAG: phosphoglycerate kinase [Candidatus Vogelbacteria bacterium]|nr:phosphoglycerate kinase [Candidatus Vogelbacteria bacterium]
MKFKSIRDAGELFGKKVLLRLDLNVSLKDGAVFDDFRIKGSLPTLNYLKDADAKIIILSHLGEGGTETLRPVADYLKVSLLPIKIDVSLKDRVAHMQNGEVIILENLRQDKREVVNDPEFAKELASLGDIYVNDAFSVSHRNHTSIVALPKLLPHYAGFLLQSEVENLSKLFNPDHPFLFILGGAKFETKINLVKKFLDIADKIFIGGALSNTIFKKMGYETGVSLVDEKEMNLDFVLNNKKIVLPMDVTVRDAMGDSVKLPDQVLKNENILDMGPESLEATKKMIDDAKYILWNGPMGNFEKGLKQITEDLATHLSKSGAKTIVGGGDTLTAIRDLDLVDKFTFTSSGGGAMLDFLVNGTLPGIEALTF